MSKTKSDIISLCVRRRITAETALSTMREHDMSIPFDDPEGTAQAALLNVWGQRFFVIYAGHGQVDPYYANTLPVPQHDMVTRAGVKASLADHIARRADR